MCTLSHGEEGHSQRCNGAMVGISVLLTSKTIVSDNGSKFSSDEFATFMKCNGIKHFKSAPYHPATNGLAERFIQTFKNTLEFNKA
jgi:transposase InsO family protein